MAEGQVPDGEGLVFGVARTDAPLVLMIKLGQTGSHLSASRSRRGDNYQRLGGLDVFVVSITLIAYDKRNIVRIARNQIVTVHLHAHFLQTTLEHLGAVLACVVCNANAAHIEVLGLENGFQTKQIRIVGDT